MTTTVSRQPADDPTGLRYDRGDLDDNPTRLRAAEGWSITGRGPNATRIDTSPASAEQPGRAPVALPPIRPRDLHRLTVAEVERIKREGR